MAINSRYVTYEIPEKSTYNYIKLYESNTETGYFALTTSASWVYGTRATEFNLDTNKWYKIRFYDATNEQYSPYSNSFWGNAFEQRAMLASVSTSFDGASYATTSNFYETTNLTSAQVDIADVTKSLRIARAYINLVAGDQTPYKYGRNYNLDVTKRKYNAELELVKTAEVYFAAALVYQDMSDDRVTMALSGVVSSSIVEPTDITLYDDTIAGADETYPSGVTLPAVLYPSGITKTSDLIEADIYPTGQLTTASQGASNITLGDLTVSQANQMEIGKFNLDKKLNIAFINNRKNIEQAQFDLDERMNLAQYNLEAKLQVERHNLQERLAILNNNIDRKNTTLNNNLDRKMAIEKYNMQKKMMFAQFTEVQKQSIVDRYMREAGFYMNLAQRYSMQAAGLINTFRPTTIPISYGEWTRKTKFVEPGDIMMFAISSIATEVTEGAAVDYKIADLTGLGVSIMSSFILNAANMVSNTVDGAAGVAVQPLEIASNLMEMTLTVNGVTYWLDAWIDNTGATQVGKAGTSNGTAGFTVAFNVGDYPTIAIQWNNTAANGGFDLTATDEIVLSYVGV